MPFNGSGTYTGPSSTWNPAVSGTTIDPTAWNALLTDLSTALSTTLLKNGTQAATALIPFANGILTDTISEFTAGVGVTIDGVVLKDGAVTEASTDAGAAAAPIHILDRNSATPAASDVLGAIAFKGRDSGAGTDTYAQVQASIVDATATSEDGSFDIQTAVAGTLATRAYVRNGIVVGAATGGDQGAGTLNATALYVNGAAVGTTIATSGVTFTTSDRILGRDTGGGGAGEELTLSAVLDMIGSPAQGDILYRGAANWERLGAGTSGQALITGGAAANPAWGTIAAGWTIATPQATTSGTAFDFTGIPSTAKEIAVLFNGVSLSGTDDFLVQIGDAGGIETTSYVSSSGDVSVNSTSTAGFVIRTQNSGTSMCGRMTLTLFEASSFTWVESQGFGRSDGPNYSGGGRKSLSAALDRVRITRSGADTFDLGSVTVAYI